MHWVEMALFCATGTRRKTQKEIDVAFQQFQMVLFESVPVCVRLWQIEFTRKARIIIDLPFVPQTIWAFGGGSIWQNKLFRRCRIGGRR